MLLSKKVGRSIFFIQKPLAIREAERYILSTVIICVFRILCKTVLQTVLPIKRFAKSFYKSAIYAGVEYNPDHPEIL